MNPLNDTAAAGESVGTRCPAAHGTGRHHLQVEVTVAVAAPSPIDMKITRPVRFIRVLRAIAVTNKTMSAIAIRTAHNQRTAILQIIIDGVLPGRCTQTRRRPGGRTSCHIGRLTRIAEIIRQGACHILRVGPGTRSVFRTILHFHGMARIFH